MKPTFVTGYAVIGEIVRHVVTRKVEERHHLRKKTRYVAMTMSGSEIDPRQALWLTLTAGRNALAAGVKGDRRFSPNGPGVFGYAAARITAKDGTLRGRPESFEDFVAHMLAVSGDKPWRGETREDREADAKAMLAQAEW